MKTVSRPAPPAEKRNPKPRRTVRKRDPKELDKMLDKAIEDSMAASDPPTIANQDVKP